MTQTQRVIDAFTGMAPEYEQTVDRELRQFWGVSYDDFIERVLERLDQGHSRDILDVATGRGAIPLALASRAEWSGRTVGLDITPEMLWGASNRVTQAREPGRISLICGSGMRLPFVVGSFDAVICALATHHMDVLTLLQEARRVLRCGGQLLVADVAPAPFWYSYTGRAVFRALAWWYGRQQDPARVAAEMDALLNMRTPEQWELALTRAGYGSLDITVIPARRRWYPQGVLICARSDHRTGS